jgi:hypothetical protein
VYWDDLNEDMKDPEFAETYTKELRRQMSWNYRVLEHANGFGIYEVYYDNDGDGSICNISSIPMEPYGETVEELKRDMDAMNAAFDKPVLNFVEVVDSFNG